MLKFVMSLSLGQGALLVAVSSGFASGASYFVKSAPLRRIVALVPPCAIAGCLYWTPVWLGRDASEYGAWAALVITLWSAAGLAVSVPMYEFIWKRGRAAAG